MAEESWDEYRARLLGLTVEEVRAQDEAIRRDVLLRDPAVREFFRLQVARALRERFGIVVPVEA